MKLPRDPDDARFTKSFAVGDAEGVRAFFEQYGVVVIRDVLTADACHDVLDSMWDIIEGSSSAISRRDPQTWGAAPTRMKKYGLVTFESIFAPSFLRTRENPNLHWAFRTLFGDDDLLVSHDRANFFRPTALDPAFKTVGGIHLDMNPTAYVRDPEGKTIARPTLDALRYGLPGSKDGRHFIEENNHVVANRGLHLQGAVNLIDNEESDGGFICVPGFHHEFAKWAGRQKPEGAAASFRFDPTRNPDICSRAVRVPQRAGSAVIWHQCLPHGSSPNASSRPRAAMFVRMLRRRDCTGPRMERRTTVLRDIFGRVGFEPSALGRGLFFGEDHD